MAAAPCATSSARSFPSNLKSIGLSQCSPAELTGISVGNQGLVLKARTRLHGMRADRRSLGEAGELQRGWCKKGGGLAVCSASAEPFTSPKTGAVGADRFKSDAAPGTYWGPSQTLGEEVVLRLDTGTDVIEARARTGENLLRVAEAAGAMTPDQDFCFEGTCSKCEMEVEGGAAEVGYRAEPGALEVVRSCICPVPGGRPERTVKMLNEEDVWGDGVL